LTAGDTATRDPISFEYAGVKIKQKREIKINVNF
jgi:hypothetical protein